MSYVVRLTHKTRDQCYILTQSSAITLEQID